MKIVVDARESGTTTGRYIDKLVEYLHGLKPSDEIVILTKPHRVQYIKEVAPSFEVIESPYSEFTFSEQLGFALQLYKLKADLVHFGMTQQPLLYFKKSITTVHDLTTARFRNPDKNPIIFMIKQQVYKVVIWYAAHKSKHVLVPTEYVKNDLVDYTHIKPEKVTVTYESADKVTDTPVPVKALVGKEFVMYLGRPTPHKNLGKLIEAFRMLNEVHPDLYLALAGKLDANYKLHMEKVAASKIPNVIFTDFITDAQLRWMYEHAKVYAFPSLSEGFGLPALEAMHYGVPVASSNATCLPEIYGDAAIYFDPTDTASIATELELLIDNKDLRTKLIQKEKEQILKYSWKRMAQETLAVYSSIFKK